MYDFLRVIGIRKATAVVAASTLAFAAGVAMADDIGGEDIVVPPPAPAPSSTPPPNGTKRKRS